MLDKELQLLLKISRNSRYAAFGKSGVEQARKNAKLLSAMTALPALELEKTENFLIPTEDGQSITIRVYWPPLQDQQVPALLYFHGGGFVLYDIDDYDSFCRYMAAHAGIAVVAVDYRRAPEHRFPSPYTDARLSLRWLLANAAGLQIDISRIAVGGDSVGGNIATFLANQSSALQYSLSLQVLIYPILTFDIEFPSHKKYGEGYFLDSQMIDWFLHLFAHPDIPMNRDERLNPYLIQFPGKSTDALVVVAEYDILRDEAMNYYNRLVQQGNKASLLYFDNLGHNFILLAGRVKACRAAVEVISKSIHDRLYNTV